MNFSPLMLGRPYENSIQTATSNISTPVAITIITTTYTTTITLNRTTNITTHNIVHGNHEWKGGADADYRSVF